MSFCLGTRGLASATTIPLKQDFTFVFNNEEFKCNRILAAFLSPAVHQILKVDPSVSQFEITMSEYPSSMFQIAMDLMQGKSVDGKKNAKFLRSLGVFLGNKELRSFMKSPDDVPEVSSVIDYLKVRFEDGCQDLDRWIQFTAAHFHELNVEDIKRLTAAELISVLKHEELKLISEDWLLDIIEQQIAVSLSYIKCVDYIKVSGLRRANIPRFLSLIDPTSVSAEVWNDITRHMRGDLSRPDRARYCHVADSYNYDGTNKLSGIINHFKSGGNDRALRDMISLDASSNRGECWNIFNWNDQRWQSSNSSPNPYLRIHFTNKLVKLSGYTLGTYGQSAGPDGWHLKNWDLHGSVDGNNWELIDSKRNNSELNGSSRNFYVAVDSDWFSYFKFTMTDQNHVGNWAMTVARVELFGDVENVENQ